MNNINKIIGGLGGLLMILGVVSADSPSLKFPLACIVMGVALLYISGYVFDDEDDDDYKY